MLPWLTSGSAPTVSMMSISPHAGQLTLLMLSPSVQNAGHSPCPAGSMMRASNRPYACANNPCVLSRALVYWHVPYQHWQRRCARRRRRDDQVASRDDGVLAAARVVLELLVAPARATDVVSPLGRVDRRAVGPV